MAIVVRLDVMLAQRKMKARQLAQEIGITEPNLSLLKSGKVKGMRFDTLERICEVLQCQPGDLLEYQPGAAANVRITHNEPGKDCAFLGDVTGSQGNFLAGAITSNADLETGARNDLKNRAAALGGNVVYLLTQRAGQTGGKDHQEQTNVTLSGNVYRCG